MTEKDNNLFFYISLISLTIAFSYLFSGVTVGNYSESFKQCCKSENVGENVFILFYLKYIIYYSVKRLAFKKTPVMGYIHFIPI